MTTSSPTLAIHRTRVPARTVPARRQRLSPSWRKAVVVVHVVASVGWLGVTATFVVLTLALLGDRDPAGLRTGYAIHELMVTWLARPAALLTLGTGLVLSLGTRWGLTRYWWVFGKLVLLVATVAVTVSTSPQLLDYVIAHAERAATPAYADAQRTLVVMAFYHVVMIGAATALSVYKPGGRRDRFRSGETDSRGLSPSSVAAPGRSRTR